MPSATNTSMLATPRRNAFHAPLWKRHPIQNCSRTQGGDRTQGSGSGICRIDCWTDQVPKPNLDPPQQCPTMVLADKNPFRQHPTRTDPSPRSSPLTCTGVASTHLSSSSHRKPSTGAARMPWNTAGTTAQTCTCTHRQPRWARSQHTQQPLPDMHPVVQAQYCAACLPCCTTQPYTALSTTNTHNNAPRCPPPHPPPNTLSQTHPVKHTHTLCDQPHSPGHIGNTMDSMNTGTVNTIAIQNSCRQAASSAACSAAPLLLLLPPSSNRLASKPAAVTASMKARGPVLVGLYHT